MPGSLSRRAALLAAGAAIFPIAGAVRDRIPRAAAPAAQATDPAPSPTPAPAIRRLVSTPGPPGPDPGALGLFVPGAPADPRPLDELASQIGRQPAFVCWYEAWGSAEAVTGPTVQRERLQTVVDRGAVPFVTWEPWDPKAGLDQPAYRPAAIARGDFDAYVNAWAERLAAWGRPVYLRMFHELNAPWYPWGVGVGGTTAADLIAAWRHVRARFAAAGAANVRWVWCPDAGLRPEAPLADLYPGDDAVDWVGLDGYNWGDNRPETGWRSFAEIFGPAYDELLGLTARPLMVAETACSERGGSKAEWIAAAFAALPTAFPRLRALAWFNEAIPNGDWPLATSPESLAAFRDAALRPELQGRLP